MRHFAVITQVHCAISCQRSSCAISIKVRDHGAPARTTFKVTSGAPPFRGLTGGVFRFLDEDQLIVHIDPRVRLFESSSVCQVLDVSEALAQSVNIDEHVDAARRIRVMHIVRRRRGFILLATLLLGAAGVASGTMLSFVASRPEAACRGHGLTQIPRHRHERSCADFSRRSTG